MPAPAEPAVQTLVLAWIQSTGTLRTYLAALPLPIRISNPHDPNQLETIGTDLGRAYQALANAPIPAKLADQLREATSLLLIVLTQIGHLLRQDADDPTWGFEGAHMVLRQANAKLNQAGTWQG